MPTTVALIPRFSHLIEVAGYTCKAGAGGIRREGGISATWKECQQQMRGRPFIWNFDVDRGVFDHGKRECFPVWDNSNVNNVPDDYRYVRCDPSAELVAEYESRTTKTCACGTPPQGSPERWCYYEDTPCVMPNGKV